MISLLTRIRPLHDYKMFKILKIALEPMEKESRNDLWRSRLPLLTTSVTVQSPHHMVQSILEFLY